jgi:PAS domain S-box-containing protein
VTHNRNIAQDLRLKQVLDLIYKLASGDLDARGNASEQGDDFDAILTGLNMLAEELRAYVDELKRAEEKIRQSEKKYRTLMEEAGDAIIIHSADGMIFETNRMVMELGGYGEGELLNRNIREFIPEDLVGAAIEMLGRLLVSGSVPIFESEVLTKDGQRIPVDINATLVEFGEGQAVQSIFRDITERKLAETAVRKSQESLARAQEIAELGNWDWEIAVDKFYWSNEMYRIFGVKKDGFDPSFEAFIEIVHPDDREAVKNAVEAALTKRKGFSIEHRIVRPDGVVRIIEERGRGMYSDKGEPLRMIGAGQDITARKEAEEKLREAKDIAEEATKLKDKFVSLVSHDLKGPLGALLGYLELFKGRGSEKFTDLEMVLFNSALESGDNMRKMIDDLLDLSRLRTGMVKPKFSFHDLRGIAVRALGQTGLRASKKGVEIKNEIPEGTRVYVDEKIFQQVLVNLIGNAAKFCNDGDSVTLSIQDGDTILVSDTGIGIEKSRLDKLFSYEEKTSTVGTAGETGTGFGLPLCMDIMKAHNGDIRVETAPNEGSRFFLELPQVKPKILLVEDSLPSRGILKIMLSPLNADIFEAANGTEAVKIIESERPDLILSDIYMPEMDGFELLQMVREDESLERTVFFIMTSDDGLEIREKAFRLGADDFLNKPVAKSDMIPRIRRYLA